MSLFLFKKTLSEFVERFFLFFAGNITTLGLFLLMIGGVLLLHGSWGLPFIGFIFLFSVMSFVWIGAYFGPTEKTKSAFVLAAHGALFGLVQIIVYLVGVSAIRFYLAQKSVIGIASAVACVLILLVWILGIIYYPFIVSLRGRGIRDSFKTSFRLFFHNFRPSIVVFLLGILFIPLTVTTAIGISFLIAYYSYAAGFFLKIDEYEIEHPDKKADWKYLFRKEIQALEDVTFKKMFFPWRK
jgi:hypothetical protein